MKSTKLLITCISIALGILFFTAESEATNKAIIVAGGGPNYWGGHLWNEIKMNSNLAYRALINNSFSHDSIYYLTADTEDIYFDVDGNGVLDEVDGDATNNNLEDAITNWAAMQKMSSYISLIMVMLENLE